MKKKHYIHPCSEEQHLTATAHLLVGSTMDIQGGGKQTGARAPDKRW